MTLPVLDLNQLADAIAERISCRSSGGDEVLTVEQAAQYLQLSPTTVRRLLRAGTLPGFKYGDQWRIHKAAVVHQLTQGTTT